jgi:hypothetical protein
MRMVTASDAPFAPRSDQTIGRISLIIRGSSVCAK